MDGQLFAAIVVLVALLLIEAIRFARQRGWIGNDGNSGRRSTGFD